MSELTSVNIELAKKSDKKDILRFYKECHYSARFIGHDHCYIIRTNKDIIACVIVSYGYIKNEDMHTARTIIQSPATTSQQQCLLHALVIKPSYRKQGLAGKLIAHSIQRHQSIVCFAQQDLAQLYIKQGFSHLTANLTKQVLNLDLFKRYTQYSKQQSKLQVFTT